MECCFFQGILLPFYAVQGLVLVILLKEIQGIHLVSWFPGVITFRVALPVYEILKHSGPSVVLVISYLLHFILFFVIDQVRWGIGVIWPMGMCFNVWGKKGCVEDWMNHP